jgi:hypothetical protein
VKPHQLRAKVSRLTRHTTYSFTVVANFDDGPGVASSPSPDVTTL